MEFLAHILVLVFSFSCTFQTFAISSGVEKSREQRVQDNENSLSSWGISHPSTHHHDSAIRAIMIGRSLASINRTTFESVDKLRTAILDLSINRISEIGEGTFQILPKLRTLKMQTNSLRHINSTTFGGLMMLEELDLSRNMISDVARDAFRIMLNLHTIDLSENCMFQLPNYVFFRNVRLINIYLKQNRLAALPVLMPTQQFVENLNVSGNSFTNMTSFAQFNNIQSLDLSDNPLVAEEMAAGESDVVKEENDSSTESDEGGNYNYLNIRYATDAKYTYQPHTLLNRTRQPARNPLAEGRRYGNRDRIDFSPDVNFMAARRARTSTVQPRATKSVYSQNLDYLMDVFRPNRMSEEALESLIKTTMEKKSEDFKVTDMIQALNTITHFYRDQDRQTLTAEMDKLNEKFDVASLVQFLRDLIKSSTTRLPRSPTQIRSQLTPEQLQQLLKATRTNHMEYFTCRNCSLQSIAFLGKYPELKYVDVSGNKIKTVNEAQLGGSMRYLVASNNEIESLNFDAMLENWPDFRVLIANNNPALNCDLVEQWQYKVVHLNKLFQLEVNKCK